MTEVFVLDTSAIFTFTDQEDGCDQVEHILDSLRVGTGDPVEDVRRARAVRGIEAP